MSLRERKHNILWFGDKPDQRWSITDPEAAEVHEALHAARYNLRSLTQSQAYILCRAVEDYIHLTTHPMGTEGVVKQLRSIRRALKCPST